MNPDDLVVIEKLNESFTTSRTQVTVGKIVKMIESNNFIHNNQLFGFCSSIYTLFILIRAVRYEI